MQEKEKLGIGPQQFPGEGGEPWDGTGKKLQGATFSV